VSAGSISQSILKRSYCSGENCAKAATCHEVARPETRLLASVVNAEILFYLNHKAFTCFQSLDLFSNGNEKIFPSRQPRTTPEANRIYRGDYDPLRCIRAIEGLGVYWQCGHRNGKGTKGLFCGRHAMASH
jgi:hypothetical protein